MTKKEKILVSYLQETKEYANEDVKEIMKFIHTVNNSFEGMSPYSWEEHHGGKKFKQKIKKLYNK
jgi:hypothetical protein